MPNFLIVRDGRVIDRDPSVDAAGFKIRDAMAGHKQFLETKELSDAEIDEVIAGIDALREGTHLVHVRFHDYGKNYDYTIMWLAAREETYTQWRLLV